MRSQGQRGSFRHRLCSRGAPRSWRKMLGRYDWAPRATARAKCGHSPLPCPKADAEEKIRRPSHAPPRVAQDSERREHVAVSNDRGSRMNPFDINGTAPYSWHCDRPQYCRIQRGESPDSRRARNRRAGQRHPARIHMSRRVVRRDVMRYVCTVEGARTQGSGKQGIWGGENSCKYHGDESRPTLTDDDPQYPLHESQPSQPPSHLLFVPLLPLPGRHSVPLQAQSARAVVQVRRVARVRGLAREEVEVHGRL